MRRNDLTLPSRACETDSPALPCWLTVVTIVTTQATPNPDDGTPYGITVDTLAGKVYWLQTFRLWNADTSPNSTPNGIFGSRIPAVRRPAFQSPNPTLNLPRRRPLTFYPDQSRRPTRQPTRQPYANSRTARRQYTGGYG